MKSSFIGFCCICKCNVDENSENSREIGSISGFHKAVLCGKASCNRKYMKRVKKLGAKEFKASLNRMPQGGKKKSLLEHGHQKKDHTRFMHLEKTRQTLFKKFALAIEHDDKASFKAHFEELKDLIAKLDKGKYKLGVVDYFIEKIHDRLCSRFNIRKDDPLPSDRNPCNILYHEIRRKVESFIGPAFDTGIRIDVFDNEHPCYEWLQ